MMRLGGRVVSVLAAAVILTSPCAFGQERHEVEVRGVKIPFRENPRKDTIVVEGEALRRLPALQIADLVALAANMNFAVRGLFQADPQMQGFNQEQIAVLVDGIPVNNAQTGHHNFLLPVAAADIARIEVLRGGFSTRFGVSGGGGRVNIVTTTGNRFSLSCGSFGTTEASVSAGKESLRAAAGYEETSGYADGLDGRRAFVRIGGRLTGESSYLDTQSGFVGARFGAARFYGPYPAAEAVSRFLGSISGGTRLGSALSGHVRLSGQASRDDFRLFRDEPARYRNIHDTVQLSAEAAVSGTSRAVEYSLGLTTTAEAIRSDGIRNGFPAPALGRHHRAIHSLRASLGSDSKPWSWHLALDAGFGLYRGTGGSLVVGRTLGQAVRLTGALARTYRIPTFTELFYSDPGHLANPYLNTERTDSASLSIDGDSGHFTAGGRVFFNRTVGLIDWLRMDEGTAWQSVNIAAGTFSGIDLRGEWSGPRETVRLMYTYQRTRFTAGGGAEMKYHFYFPDHVLSLIVSGGRGPWSASAAFKAEREEGGRKIRPYLSVRLLRKMGRWEAFLDLRNLFDQRVERVPGLPEAPRSARLGLALAF